MANNTATVPMAHQLVIHAYSAGRVTNGVNLASSATTSSGM